MSSDDKRKLIAQRAAAMLTPGKIVNLGVGIPVLVADCLGADSGVFLHTENGMLGVGPFPAPGEGDPDIVNAAKQMVTETVGVSYFDSATSFGMIRGGHIDVAILGALQVDERGRVANWAVPGAPVLGVGGAMDIMVGARKVIITMLHTTPRGEPRFVRECTMPVTAERPADILITDLGVFEFDSGHWVLKELMPGATLELIQRHTTARFEFASPLPVWSGVSGVGVA